MPYNAWAQWWWIIGIIAIGLAIWYFLPGENRRRVGLGNGQRENPKPENKPDQPE